MSASGTIHSEIASFFLMLLNHYYYSRQEHTVNEHTRILQQPAATAPADKSPVPYKRQSRASLYVEFYRFFESFIAQMKIEVKASTNWSKIFDMKLPQEKD